MKNVSEQLKVEFNTEPDPLTVEKILKFILEQNKKGYEHLTFKDTYIPTTICDEVVESINGLLYSKLFFQDFGDFMFIWGSLRDILSCNEL